MMDGRIDALNGLVEDDSERALAELCAGPAVVGDGKRRWFVTSYAAALDAVRDPRFSSDTRNAAVVDGGVEVSTAFGGSEMPLRPYLFFDPPPFVAARPFLFLDPPDHTRLRRLVSRAFTPSMVSDMRPTIERLVIDLLPDPGEPLEVMAELAYPLPMRVIMNMLGLPGELEADIRRWTPPLAGILTADSLRTPEQRDEARVAQFTLAPLLAEQVTARRDRPGDDLLTGLVRAEADGDVLTPFEVVSTALLLLLAGHETTANLIGNAVVNLMRHPEQLAQVRRDPGLVDAAVEETLRYSPPVQLIARTAIEDIQLDGVDISAGDHVVVVVAAANRDGNRFENPHDFDVLRPRAEGHLAFGFGVHHCIGAVLARIEAEVAIAALLPYLDQYRLPDPVAWRDDVVIRGPLHLELTAC